MVNVYLCRSSLEEDRPEIDYELEENRRNDWLRIGEVLDGESAIEAYPLLVSVRVDHPDATEWDFYMCPGTSGLFSQRFVDTVGADALRYFSLLPCRLNGQPYFFLRCEQRVDCFDRNNARFVTFPHDPTRIMDIQHYAFVDARVPEGAFFCIPEVPDLFVTETVMRRIADAGLKGVRTALLP